MIKTHKIVERKYWSKYLELTAWGDSYEGLCNCWECHKFRSEYEAWEKGYLAGCAGMIGESTTPCAKCGRPATTQAGEFPRFDVCEECK